MKVAQERFRPLPSGWWIEIFTGCMTIYWAMAFAMISGNVSNPKAYRLAFTILYPDHWIIAGILLGVAQIIACLYRVRNYRFICALLMSAFWSILAYTIYLEDDNVLGVVFYAGLAKVSAVAMLLLFRRRGYER